jgi:hypothetical protein
MGQNENVILVQGEIEDTTGVLRICKSKNRQHNGQTKKDKQPKKGQTTIYKTYTSKDRVIGTPIKSHNKCIINGD